MVSARTNGRNKRHDLDENKYSKKKKLRKKQRRKARNNTLYYYKGTIVFCVVLLCWLYVRKHWSWKQQQLKLARLKRAYSLERVRQQDTDEKKHATEKDESFHPPLLEANEEKPQPQSVNWKNQYSNKDLEHAMHWYPRENSRIHSQEEATSLLTIPVPTYLSKMFPSLSMARYGYGTFASALQH